MALLLVTRPEGQQHHLVEALQAQGHEVRHQPLIRIVPQPSDDQALKQCFLDLDLYQAVIAISANAAEAGLEWLDNYWPQPPVGIRWYGVGPASVAPMRREGLPAELPQSRYDSEGLLALQSLQAEQVAGEKILIWRGVGGRETLAEVLRQRGARVDYAELYAREEIGLSTPQWASLLADKPWLVLSSGQALDIVEQQVAGLDQRISGLILPSERVAEQARAAGYQKVLVPASARDQDMLACIREQL